jgi:hypothetical protein
MEVIKKGNPKGWEKEVTCTGKGNHNDGCGAVLKVCKDDLFISETSSYDGSGESYITIRCCECGVWTDLGSPYSGDFRFANRTNLPTPKAWYNSHGINWDKGDY